MGTAPQRRPEGTHWRVHHRFFLQGDIYRQLVITAICAPTMAKGAVDPGVRVPMGRSAGSARPAMSFERACFGYTQSPRGQPGRAVREE